MSEKKDKQKAIILVIVLFMIGIVGTYFVFLGDFRTFGKVFTTPVLEEDPLTEQENVEATGIVREVSILVLFVVILGIAFVGTAIGFAVKKEHGDEKIPTQQQEETKPQSTGHSFVSVVSDTSHSLKEHALQGEDQNIPKEDPAIARLRTYIDECLRKGVKKKDLMKYLIDAGWGKDLVKKYLK